MERFTSLPYARAESALVMPPVYVISMASDAKRCDNVIELCARKDISVRYFPAIALKDREQITAYDAAYRQRHFGYALSAGELGCFLSHQTLWRECLRLGRSICILEDDVELPADFAQILRRALACESDWDVLRLLAERWDRKGFVVGRFDETHTLCHYPRPAMGTAAYLLTPKAAERLLTTTETIRVPVDQVIDQFWHHHLRVLVVEPYPVCIRADCPSVIAVRGWSTSHGKRKRPLYRRVQRDLRNAVESIAGWWYSLPWMGRSWWYRRERDY
ncbi:glycosyltransferase family 25 protein [Acidithiobacillus sp. IBUN Pt1247-S3]|uniref:glycosyltransferase family 25 protein n=1 Tax=Acidithiobacillus sp. IBUN Pt1247-S3 TaxID=3166642 RepID=UPI0034E6135B